MDRAPTVRGPAEAGSMAAEESVTPLGLGAMCGTTAMQRRVVEGGGGEVLAGLIEMLFTRRNER